MPESASSIILYQTPDGQARIEVKLENETVWLTQAQMCELFDKSKGSISEHISHVFNEGELHPEWVVRKIRTTATDGKNYDIEYYNLDVIISVGYRVKSQRGTQFRIWATERLREYIIKGFVLDDARLKEAGYSNSYFQELLERIRDIRTSEKNFYYKVREIYKLSCDYEEDSDATQKFFKEIQNKFHYAIHGHTAAEIINERADAKKPNMGLTTWKGQSKWGKIRKDDTIIAKNYLSENEIKNLNLLVEQFLAFAEIQAIRNKVMYMRDWIKKLRTILEMNDMQVLENAGVISHDKAQKKAETEYEKYRKNLDTEEIDMLESLEGWMKKITSEERISE